MVSRNEVLLTVALLISAKWAAQLWLEHLNRKHVLAHAASVPEAFQQIIDPPTYHKSVEYTLAKSRLHRAELTWDAVVLLVVLGSGILPLLFNRFTYAFGYSAWSLAAFLFATGMVLTIVDLPWDWYAQFRLEERFGFNTTTHKL